MRIEQEKADADDAARIKAEADAAAKAKADKEALRIKAESDALALQQKLDAEKKARSTIPAKGEQPKACCVTF